MRIVSACAAARLATRAGIAPFERAIVVIEALRRSHERRILRQVADPAFVPRSRALARRLRLRVDDVNAAVARLVRDRRLTMISPSHWVVSPEETG
jgi:hypothetical protein